MTNPIKTLMTALRKTVAEEYGMKHAMRGKRTFNGITLMKFFHVWVNIPFLDFVDEVSDNGIIDLIVTTLVFESRETYW